MSGQADMTDSSPPLRPSSPEAACPICLEDINNSSVTNSCAHRFCFTCLCEWAKVKPECPLCKQRFTIIFHTIKSMIDFQEYRLDRALLEPRLDPPRIFLALQQGSRPAFGYRTTMGFHGFETAVPRAVSSRSRIMLMTHGLLSPGSRVSSAGFTPSSAPNATGRVSASAIRSSLEFRRNVYRHNLWVRPSPDQDRVRESSPEFYRMNPATTHRLAAWLSRELSVLLDTNVIARENACRGILNLLYTYRIDSPDFRHLVLPQLGDRTLHFAHEFYHFAISPHDLPAYDAHARYVNGTEDGASDEPLIDAPIDEFGQPFIIPDQGGYPAMHGSAATTQLDEHIRSVTRGLVADLRHTARQIAMNRNRGTGMSMALSSYVDSLSTNLRRSSFSPLLPLLRPERSSAPEVITLSSDEADLADDASDDSDVQIICSLPPHHLLPPLEITDSDDSDVIVIPVPPPPIIEIDDDDDEPSAVKASPPSSPTSCAGGPSTSNGGEGPSTLNASVTTEKRSARFTRPFYCEFSSSSDDNDDVDHAPPKKSSPTKRKARPRKRLRNYKSSKYVKDDSDSGSEEDKPEIKADKVEEVSDEEDTSRRASSKKNSRSRKNSSSSSKASRKKERQSSTSSTLRKESSYASKTRTAASSRKDPVDEVSTDDDTCSQCGKSSIHPLVSESKIKRKRFNSCECRQSKKKRRRSSAGDSSQSSESARAATSVIEKPKALSKKDIILNKRRSELSTMMNASVDSQRPLEAFHKRRPAFDIDVQGDDSRSTVKSTETDDDKSNDTILSMGQEYTTLATVSNASSSDALSGASFSSSHRQVEPYQTPSDMSPPNLRRFDDATPIHGAFARYYPCSSSTASSSNTSLSLSPMVRGGPPRLKSIVVRPTPTYWSPSSPKSQPSTCTDDSNDNYAF